MQTITRDAGEAFANEVAYWVGAGLRIVGPADPQRVVLVDPEPPRWPAQGRWLRRLRRRRAVTITMRVGESTTAIPPATGGYGASWQ